MSWVALMVGFYILILAVEQKKVTKWHSNGAPGLVLGAFCTIFEPGPSGGSWGQVRPESGRKSTRTRVIDLSFLVRVPFSNPEVLN